jgi:transposase-like protein
MVLSALIHSFATQYFNSTSATVDFLLSALRDAEAAKRLFRKALSRPSHPQPRVINTDLAPTYGSAIPDIKEGRDPSPSLSASTRAVLEQYSGAGSPSHQTPCER